MNGGKGSLSVPVGSIKGIGFARPSTPEEIEEIKCKERKMNPMEKIAAGGDTATPATVEVADKIVDGPKTNIDDNDSQGRIEKSGTQDEPATSESDKDGFDSTSTKNAMAPSSDEDGGIMKNVTTGIHTTSDEDGKATQPTAKIEDDKAAKGGFEIIGFAIQYSIDDGKTHQTEDVHEFCDTKQEALDRFTGVHYMCVRNDKIVKGLITKGAPTICHNERQIYEYVNNQWRRS